jgi:hypothetical protein
MKIIALVLMTAFALTNCGNKDVANENASHSCHGGSFTSEEIPPSLPAEFHGIRYTVDVYSFGANGKCVRHITKAPEHAVKFGEGILLGGDRGEWGGELVFRDQNDRDRKIIDENVISIIVDAKNAFVLTGLNHMGSNFGALYSLPNDGKAGAGNPSLIAKFDEAPSAFEFYDYLGFRIAFRSPEVSVNTLYVCYSPLSTGKSREIPCDERWGKKKAF